MTNPSGDRCLNRKNMTTEQFLDALARLGLSWSLRRSGQLRSCVYDRTERRYHCPISAVVCARAPMTRREDAYIMPTRYAREVLKMPEIEAFRIQKAADNQEPTELRKKLLAACGLDQPPT